MPLEGGPPGVGFAADTLVAVVTVLRLNMLPHGAHRLELLGAHLANKHARRHSQFSSFLRDLPQAALPVPAKRRLIEKCLPTILALELSDVKMLVDMADIAGLLLKDLPAEFAGEVASPVVDALDVVLEPGAMHGEAAGTADVQLFGVDGFHVSLQPGFIVVLFVTLLAFVALPPVPVPDVTPQTLAVHRGEGTLRTHLRFPGFRAVDVRKLLPQGERVSGTGRRRLA